MEERENVLEVLLRDSTPKNGGNDQAACRRLRATRTNREHKMKTQEHTFHPGFSPGDGSSLEFHEELTLKRVADLEALNAELLEACKALQMEARARGCGLRIADEAIAKAEGQE